MQARVIKPVNACEKCQAHFQELKTLYSMHVACPSDPGALGTLQIALEIYREHHKIHGVKDYE